MSAYIIDNESNYGDDGGGGKVRARSAEFPSAHPEIRRFAIHNELNYDQGYDSDEEMMYYDEIAIDDDTDNISEDVIEPGKVSAMTTSTTTTLATTTSEMTIVAFVQLLEERTRKLKVPELKDDLKKRGEGTGGNKKILFDPPIECIWYKTPVGEKNWGETWMHE